MNAISPKRDEDFPNWYQQVVKPLAQHGMVRGTQVIKPWGYGVWSLIKSELDQRIQSKGCENFYAPLFVGLDALSQEASHIDGFATECAVVTHSRLSLKDGKLVPDSELTEPVVVRPTSEAIIGPIVKDWIESHRDLPMKLNQWANVVRWEMRTRLFLRSSEFLWQEGHTFHASAKEADAFAKDMWQCYADLVKDVLAMPAIIGTKTETERFAGAEQTYTFELLMQDGKALQGGTSHYLGQMFSKAYDISFTNSEGKVEHVYGTSWGVTTRMIGAMVMVHGDDDGLRIPPKVAPKQVVIIPINPKNDPKVDEACEQVKADIEKMSYAGSNIRVHIDQRDVRGGGKSWDWVKKGVPVRIEIGPRDLENQTVCLTRRDQGVKDKSFMPMNELDQLPSILEEIQNKLYEDAKAFLDSNTFSVQNQSELIDHFEKGGSGMVKIPYLDDPEVEKSLSKYQVSVRCLLECDEQPCGFSQKPTKTIAVIAKGY